MSEFWLISVPGENTPQKAWERLNQATSTGPEKLSNNFKFNIPDLRVGTLDVLVGLSDDLGKLDVYTEGVTRKIAQYLGEVLEDTRDKLMENLKIGEASPQTYLHKFTWEGAKYPIKQSLRFLADMIGKQVSQIEADLKTKSQSYNNLKGNLQSLERKATGSLLTRNLADLVKKEDFVLDSEYLITLLVIVPKNIQSEWFAKYEKLTDMVVPRSSRILHEDADSLLVNVTLFQRVADEFKHHCRENKFVVRDFVYNEKEIEEGKTQVSKLEADKKKQYGPLVKWLRINFGETFTAWMHVKALRVFVESVLRYGLPVNFQAVVMQPNKRSQKRLREVLNQLYQHLDNAHVSSADTAAASMEIPGLNLGSADYYPYVYYRINLDLLDTRL